MLLKAFSWKVRFNEITAKQKYCTCKKAILCLLWSDKWND